jgi:hypothetical protein
MALRKTMPSSSTSQWNVGTSTELTLSSGHGTTAEDTNGDESDGTDEGELRGRTKVRRQS